MTQVPMDRFQTFGVSLPVESVSRIVRQRRALPLSSLTMCPPSGRVSACRRQGVSFSCRLTYLSAKDIVYFKPPAAIARAGDRQRRATAR